jgi:hypothetical protein
MNSVYLCAILGRTTAKNQITAALLNSTIGRDTGPVRSSYIPVTYFPENHFYTPSQILLGTIPWAFNLKILKTFLFPCIRAACSAHRKVLGLTANRNPRWVVCNIHTFPPYTPNRLNLPCAHFFPNACNLCSSLQWRHQFQKIDKPEVDWSCYTL